MNARCDVYPKGEDRAKSSGLCTFSQRQGAVSIQLQNGKRYDLVPVGNQPGNYRDQDGKAAYRQFGLGDKGQIYRFANESIYSNPKWEWNKGRRGTAPVLGSREFLSFNQVGLLYVYWDTAPYGNQGSTMGRSPTTAQPDAGTPVARLNDLVGARAGQAENAIKQRGYRFVKASPSGNSVYSQWLEDKTNYCVTILTEEGRYQSIVYAGNSADCQK